MTIKFNYDISMNEVNLPPLNNYDRAKKLINVMKIGKFNKKYWGSLKHKITESERSLNTHMRKRGEVRTYGRKAVEVDFSMVTERDNVFWFRPGECFANVIVPVFMLNDRQSSPNDRYQIIVNSYHAAIYDMRESIIYDPTIDTLDEIGANYESDEKKISILGLLMTPEAISFQGTQLTVGTLSLAEYMNTMRCGKTNKPLRDFFNEAMGREVIKAENIGTDLRKPFLG